MNTEKPIESHTAADFLQYALDNPVQPSPDEEPDIESKSHEQVDPSAALRSARDDNEPSAEAEDEDISEESEENTEETDSESEDRTEPDEDDQTDDEDDNPQLDPLIEELAKGNPNAEKRVKEIAQGLQKLKTESKQLKTDLETTKPRADAWDSYQKALEDPMFAGPTLEKLIEAVAQHHGISTEELIPGAIGDYTKIATSASPPRNDNEGPTWMRRGYASEKEM